MTREQVGLIETSRAFSCAMQRDRQGEPSLESFLLHVIPKLASQRLGERNTAGILEVVEDSAHAGR